MRRLGTYTCCTARFQCCFVFLLFVEEVLWYRVVTVVTVMNNGDKITMTIAMIENRVERIENQAGCLLRPA